MALLDPDQSEPFYRPKYFLLNPSRNNPSMDKADSARKVFNVNAWNLILVIRAEQESLAGPQWSRVSLRFVDIGPGHSYFRV